jgi:ppGpp synthetase/RelA/SpoT-type nucleotidyltranferase
LNHRDELAYNPSALIDLPEGSSKRPKRIASAAEAAELLAVLPVEDRQRTAPSGYRAIHHIVRRNGRLIEVQLRTVPQDAWANQVEEDSRRLATGYKFGRGGEDVHDYYRIVSEAFAALDRDEDLSPDLVAAINENYANVAETLQRRPPRGDR